MSEFLSKNQPTFRTRYLKQKVLLLGDGAVGKTSLIRKFVMDKFDDKYIATIGSKVTKKELEFTIKGELVFLTLIIWDVLGQKGYRKIQSASFMGAKGVILVCDYTRKETLESLEEYWLANLGENLPKLTLVFVANKMDLKEEGQFSLNELEELASRYNAVCYESSAKTGENVEDLFLTLGKRLMEDEGEEKHQLSIPSIDLSGEMTIVGVCDQIIDDFCKSFGDMERAIPVVKQQFVKASEDIRTPTKEGLLKVIDGLAEVERGYKDESTVRANRTKRRLLLRKVKN